MKKVLALTIFAFVGLFMTGCNDTTVQEKTCEEDPTQPKCSEEVKYDFGGRDFIIMANNPQTADPFSDSFEGLYQREKQKNQRSVEEKYHIKVKYVGYPAEATWGSARDNHIINNEITGQAAAHVYNISSSSIPVLATAGAIAPVGDYYNDYANEQFLEYKKEFVKYKDDYYGYDDSYPYVDQGLYYNQDLLNELGYAPNYPTDMWLKDEWTWDTFESFIKELNTKLDQQAGEYPMGGKFHDWSDGMVPANGGYYLNGELEVGVTSPETTFALQKLAEMYAIPGMWINEVDAAYSTEENFKQGKVVFNPGAHWHLFSPSRMGAKDRPFDIGYVPYPKGKHVVEGTAEYKGISQIWGPATFVYSSSYEDTPDGYEKVMFTTKTIYMIHSELLYFGDLEDTFIDLSIDFKKYYADDESVQAHRQVLNKVQNEMLYGLGEDAFGYEPECFVNQIDKAIRENSVRAQMTILAEDMKESIKTLFE